jgi:ABC-2 type transport system ATP-binding protein
MSIEIKNIFKQYGTQKAVNNISFKINKGEIVGFLGPNGAGKSTTMKMITGYLQADAGIALVCNIDVKENPLASKQKIGYLPESNALYTDMYVREYLAFVADVHKIENQKSKIEQIIQQVGLTTEAHKKISSLSKGYKQRVGLAAAIIHDPEVLILDEPTSGLDPNQIIEIRNVIKELGKNKTVLFSSHIMQEVEAICERVIIIDKGSIVADEKLSTLQQQTTGSSVQVTFKEELEAALLQNLPAATTIKQTDAYSWELQSNDEEALRKQILSLAIEKNLNIVSLQSGSNSLEDVFRSLTQVKL